MVEIQQAFRELLARRPPEIAPRSAAKPAGAAAQGGRTTPVGDDHRPGSHRNDPTPVPSGVDLDRQWVTVVAAHSGAGASTVALAIADAADAAGRATTLVESAHPTRSGLVAAANAELGLDPSGEWRRGSRGQITLDRRASTDTPTGWPTMTDPDGGLVIVDLGLPTPDSLARLAASGCRVVVVCRPTVPGVRLAEQLLTSLADPQIVASVGARKWPGEVTASLGPRLRQLRATNAVVTVPADRRLEVTGPTNSPLPKPVAAAGRALLGLIDAARPGDAPGLRPSVPRRNGTTR